MARAAQLKAMDFHRDILLPPRAYDEYGVLRTEVVNIELADVSTKYKCLCVGH